MATTSGVINISEITKIEYADVDVSLSSVPVTLEEISIATIKQGGFKLEFGAPSVTQHYLETGFAYGSTESPAAQAATIELATATASIIADFSKAVLTAGTSGTAPDKLKFGGANSMAANKYLKVTGKNTDGKVITVELYNTGVTNSWSGANGKSVEPSAFTIQLSVLYNRGMDATWQATAEF